MNIELDTTEITKLKGILRHIITTRSVDLSDMGALLDIYIKLENNVKDNNNSAALSIYSLAVNKYVKLTEIRGFLNYFANPDERQKFIQKLVNELHDANSKRIEAIKFTRYHLNIGLKEAKDLLDEFTKNNPSLFTTHQYEAFMKSRYPSNGY